MFNALRAPLSALPDLFSALAHARVALARLDDMLSSADPADPAASLAEAATVGIPLIDAAPAAPATPSDRGRRRDTARHGGAHYSAASAPPSPVICLRDASFSWKPAAAAASACDVFLAGDVESSGGLRAQRPQVPPPASSSAT